MTGGGGDGGIELGLDEDSEALFCRAREELRALGLDPGRVVREAGT